MDEELLDLLVERLRAASSARALQGLLRAINQEQKLRPGELRVTGTKDELLENARSGCQRGLVPIIRLVQLVDRLEENGSQHVFLFDLTEKGLHALTAEALKSTFPLLPHEPPRELYANRPKDSVQLSERPDAIVVKQVYTATYWSRTKAAHSPEKPNERPIKFNATVARSTYSDSFLNRERPRFESTESWSTTETSKLSCNAFGNSWIQLPRSSMSKITFCQRRSGMPLGRL